MPYPRRLLSSDEDIEREFHPHWSTLITPALIVVATTIAGTLLGVFVDTITRTWLAALIGLLLGVVVTVPSWVRWKFTWFVVTNERIIARRGLFTRAGKEIPLEVINDVAFGQTFGERIFRSGDLLVESAGEQGQSRFSDIPDPEGVQSLIYKLRERRQRSLQTNTSVATELETLARLRDEGVLSEEEFAEQKRRLLD